VILIAGPTASGKSAAALAVAAHCGGEIVNADAMQIYRDLDIVTARPGADDQQIAPHHLYGCLDGAASFSAGRWADMAVAAIDAINGRNKVAIVTGGTGLYFKALEDGLSPIPDIPLELREQASARREEIGAAAFRAAVIANDPAMARLPEADAQRLIRAWEVFEWTGKPLSYFQAQARKPLIGAGAMRLVIAPPRERLYENCNSRAAMMWEGAIEEVRRLLARQLDPALPVMKALGVREIAALLRGEMDTDEALGALQQNTRRFAKRQMTWFRHQTADWKVVESADDAVAILTL